MSTSGTSPLARKIFLALELHRLEYGPKGYWFCSRDQREGRRYCDRMNWDWRHEAELHVATEIANVVETPHD